LSLALEERSVFVSRLERDRPRRPFLRGSLVVLGILVVAAWTLGGIDPGDLLSLRRRAHLSEFVRNEVVPFPLRDQPFSWSALWAWMDPLLSTRGVPGALATLWISILAIVLAAIVALLLAPLGARNLSSPDPWLDGEAGKSARPWRLLVATTRAACIALRAIPEYVWAFLLLAMLGPGAWPAVLALAIHNAGILGRLGSETIENLDRAPLVALRALGAGRRQITMTAIPHLASGRFLLYLFYRFETCVREATVLGMLGVVSLGYWIQDARARQFHDEMLLLVALGAVIVLIADILSLLARSWVRRAR
jgi:phosphonate transport system permease protein